MDKESIFFEESNKELPEGIYPGMANTKIYNAMERFAKQEAIGFAKFVFTNHYHPFGNAWTNDMLKTLTTEELYSLYKSQVK